jgi:hypothetical protein
MSANKCKMSSSPSAYTVLEANESSNNAIDCFTLLLRIPEVPDSISIPQDRLLLT